MSVQVPVTPSTRRIAGLLRDAGGAVFNIMHPRYGASGLGGATDDTPAATAALADLAANGGGTFYLPRPLVRYNIAGGLQLPDNCRMLGDFAELHQTVVGAAMIVPGNDNEIGGLKFTGVGATAAPYFGRGFIYNDPNNTGLIGARVYLHDLLFDATVGVSGITGVNCVDWLIERVRMVLNANAEHALYLSGGGARITLRDLYLEKTASNGFSCIAINIKGCDRVRGSDIQIVGPGWDNGGISSSTAASTRLRFRHVDISGLTGGAIPIVLGNAAQDTDVVLDQIDIDGGFHGVQTRAKNARFTNLRIKNVTNRAVDVDGTTYDVSGFRLRGFDFEGNGAGVRLFNAGAESHIRHGKIKGIGSGNGVDWDSGSVVGSLVEGVTSTGHTTDFRYNVAGVKQSNNNSTAAQWDDTGTFTPALKFGGASVGLTYGTQTGTWVKRGNRVRVEISITLTAKGSSVGAATITGLPFAAAAGALTSATPLAGFGTLTYTTPPGVTTTASGAALNLVAAGASGGAATNLTDANFANTTSLLITHEYEV